MFFSSLIFVAAFLPVFFLCYYGLPGTRQKNAVLLLFSLGFYAWAGIPFLLLLLAVTLLVTEIGRAMEGKRAPGLLPGGVGIVLGILCVFKYGGFFGLSLGLPLGISFYSFKLISYLADVHRGRISAKPYGQVLLYTLMFPTVTQGPITRFSELSDAMSERKISLEDFSEGMFRFSVGLGKKTLLADPVGRLGAELVPLTFLSDGLSLTGSRAWLAGLCYMLQLYLDFSAYSDMAIGLGRTMGFHFAENFDYPYAAVSVRDFWRRWHISLSEFFRDYVYIPLGGNRGSLSLLLRNTLIVWLLTGIWHGSTLNFLLWGFYYFCFLTLENLLRRWQKKRQTAMEEGENTDSAEGKTASLMYRLLGHGYTLLVVYFGWVLFRYSDFPSLLAVLRVMLFPGNAGFSDSFAWLSLKNHCLLLLVCALAATPLASILGERMRASMRRAEALRRKGLLRQQEAAQGAAFGDDSLKDLEQLAETAAEEEAEAVRTADAHTAAYQRLRKQIRRRRRSAGRAEAVYYLERAVIALGLLGLSILAMVGNSYTPFLYNQF